MNRRNVLLAAAVLLGTAAVARAQVPVGRLRIGVLLPGPVATYETGIANLRSALGDRGYVEPRSLQLVFRHAGTELDRLPALARELVEAEVDIIVTSATPGARAAMAATKTIPIVIASAADVVGSGLVASLARPGGNVTGLTLLIPDLGAKQLELLGEFVPGLARVGILRGKGEGAQAFETIRAAAAARGIAARFEEVESVAEIAPALAAMTAARCQAVIVVDGPSLNAQTELIARLLVDHRLPAISTLRIYVDAGSLASYGPNVAANWRRAAYFVDRIAKGARPGELPVEQPTVFELAINRRAAKALGLAIPQAVLLRADAVID